MLLPTNTAVEQVVIVTTIVNARLYFHASDVHQHTFNRSRVVTALRQGRAISLARGLL